MNEETKPETPAPTCDHIWVACAFSRDVVCVKCHLVMEPANLGAEPKPLLDRQEG